MISKSRRRYSPSVTCYLINRCVHHLMVDKQGSCQALDLTQIAPRQRRLSATLFTLPRPLLHELQDKLITVVTMLSKHCCCSLRSDLLPREQRAAVVLFPTSTAITNIALARTSRNAKNVLTAGNQNRNIRPGKSSRVSFQFSYLSQRARQLRNHSQSERVS